MFDRCFKVELGIDHQYTDQTKLILTPAPLCDQENFCHA
jgi:hypothetical protein